MEGSKHATGLWQYDKTCIRPSVFPELENLYTSTSTFWKPIHLCQQL